MSESKKVLYVFQHYAEHPGMSGRTRHYHMSRAIADLYEVYIFSSGFSHNQKKYAVNFDSSSYFKVEDVNGINYVWIRTVPYAKNNWRRYANMLDYSLKAFCSHFSIRDKPGFVMASVAHSLSLLVGYLVSRLHRVPFIVDIGDLWPDALVSAGALRQGSVREAFLRVLSYSLYRKADTVVCLTKCAKSRLIEIGVREDRIHVIYPCREISERRLAAADNADEKRKFTVVYAGSFNSIYPLDLIVDAAIMLNAKGYEQIEIILIGDGERWRHIASRCGDVPTVKVMRSIPQERLVDTVYPRADIFLVVENNVQYGFPNKLIEYMMCGKPVVLVTPTRYLDELSLRSFFYIDTYDPGDIAELIIDLYEMRHSQPDVFSSLGEENKIAAQKLFSLERCRSDLIKCFDGARCGAGTSDESRASKSVSKPQAAAIRGMRLSDVEDVVDIHVNAFPSHFLTYLGRRFLGIYYAEVAASRAGLSYVCVVGDKVVGFVVGFRSPGSFYGRLLRKRWIRFGLSAMHAVIRRPRTLFRLLGAFKKEREMPAASSVAELSSLSVSPDAANMGYGSLLVKHFIEGASASGVASIYLRTDALDNDRVNAFYEDRGFKLRRQITTPEGRKLSEYWYYVDAGNTTA